VIEYTVVSTALVDGRIEDILCPLLCRGVFETRIRIDLETRQRCVEMVGRVEALSVRLQMFSLMSSRILMYLDGTSRPDVAKADGRTTGYRLANSR
jgi:hypothetical protein